MTSVAEECDGCGLPFFDFQTDFMKHSGDRLCQWCRAVFWTAAVLFQEGIDQEDTIIPTLAFAKFGAGSPEYRALKELNGVAQKLLPRDVARILLREGSISERAVDDAYLGWKHVRVVEAVPIIRVLPHTVFAQEDQGTGRLEQVRIQVVSKYADPRGIREDYERVLLAQGVQWDENESGCISYTYSRNYLDIRIGPSDTLRHVEARDALPLELLERYPDLYLRMAYQKSFPPERRNHHSYHFPPPEFIEGYFKAHRGALRGKKRNRLVDALDLYGKPIPKTAEKIIPAFVAWHVGGGIGGKISPGARARVSRTLNKHLLDPCGKQCLSEEAWVEQGPLWRDAEELSKRFDRIYRAGHDRPLSR